MDIDKKLTSEEQLEMLFQYKGNIKLFNSIKRFDNLNIIIDELELKENFSKEIIINEYALVVLNTVIFNVLEAIFLFEDKPIKCLSWTKGILKRYVTNDAVFLKSLIVEELQDKNRFQTETNIRHHIIKEISDYDCSNLPDEPHIVCGMFEHFTGEKSYSDIKKVLESFASVRGFLKQKSDIVSDFIITHRTEIIKQLQNEITPLPKTSPSQHNYKKHPTGLDLIRLPKAILEKYSICCEYKYIHVSGFGEVPIPLFAISGVEHQNIDIKTIPLKAYAEGFIQGYNSNLIPFIDSFDTRKEVILYESIFKGGQGFTESHNEKGIEYKTESMFESGLFEGKRYKAWEIIFETPSAFIQHFEHLPSQKIKTTNSIIPSKVDDIKKAKLFIDYLKHDKPEQLAQKLKVKFAGCKGKEIALMIYTIKDYLIDEPIVKKEFYKAMAEYFEKPLSKDSAMNRYLDSDFNHKYKSVPHWKTDFEKMKTRITDIIEAIKSNS